MSIPKGSPTKLNPSRQLVPGSLINDMNDALFSFQQLTALGVAQVDAAVIDAANVEILSGSANNAGAKLPVSYPGAIVSILNNSLNTTKIYGNGTDTIQTTGTTFAASVDMATLVNITLRCIKQGFWQRVILA